MLVADGFDEAIIGISSKDIYVYSIPKMVAILMHQGMTHEEAEEYFYFNIEQAYVGQHTPIYVHDGNEDK